MESKSSFLCTPPKCVALSEYTDRAYIEVKDLCSRYMNGSDVYDRCGHDTELLIYLFVYLLIDLLRRLPPAVQGVPKARDEARRLRAERARRRRLRHCVHGGDPV